MQDKDKHDYWDQWEKLLEMAAAFQGLLPGAVLIGGSAAALHVKDRFSFDADHILSDLDKNYEKVLDFLEARDDWETARIHPPKLILGNFRGVETGIRQLMRNRPLETQQIETASGKYITLPTVREMLRTKAWMIISRNATRDFIDFAALADHLGIEAAVRVLEDLDDYYADLISGGKASPVVQLIRQLAEPSPGDLDEIDLSRYKGIRAPFDSWGHIVDICTRISLALGNRLADSLKC
jgi:hypothetical protein